MVPYLSAESGLKSSPVFDSKGLSAECLYNPNIRLGGLVKIQSQISAATGIWRVNGLKHRLESENPGGKWLTRIKASKMGEASSSGAESVDGGE
jgi:hypothetical protein